MSGGHYYCPYIPLVVVTTAMASLLSPAGKRMAKNSNTFITQIIEECNKIIEPNSDINLVFGNLLYKANGSFHKIKTIEFRDKNLSLLITKSNQISCIIHHDGTVASLQEVEEIDIQQRLNKVFSKIEDSYETSIEEFTDGNFQYFDL